MKIANPSDNRCRNKMEGHIHRREEPSIILRAALQRAAGRESDGAFHVLNDFLTGNHSNEVKDVSTILLKPVGDACNLRCTYCYETLRLHTHKPKILSLADAKMIIDNSLIPDGGIQSLFFHGGEPMLAGLDYYKELIKFIRLKKKGVKLGIQTNGILITEDWARLILDEHISVGISLDGPEHIHNAERLDAKGVGTFAGVMKGIDTLRAQGVLPGIISVFTNETASDIGNAYDYVSFFSEEGLFHIDAHPALTPEATSGRSALKNVTRENYSLYMTALFDAWLELGDPDLRIRSFEDYFENATSIPTDTCTASGSCTSIMGIDSNGCAVPCTRPFSKKYGFGNLKDSTIEELIKSETFKSFKSEESSGQQSTRSCKWSRFCGNGGCPHERLDKKGNQNPSGKHIYCSCNVDENAGYPGLFGHIEDVINNLILT